MSYIRRPFWLGPAAFFAFLIVSGCASTEHASGRLEGVKTVGIISAVGDKFSFTQAGLVGLDGGDGSVAIEPWGIDERIIDRATSVLGKRFQVQSISYQREAFSVSERTSSIPGVELLRDDPFKALVRNDVSPQGLDAYIVITKATLKYGTRGVPVSGIGVIKQNTLLESYAIVHALYVIRVIDGQTFRTIDKKSAAPVDSASISRLAGPSRKLDVATLPPASDLASDERIKSTVLDLVERSLEATLGDLHLTAP